MVNETCKNIWRFLKHNWRTIVLILVPLILFILAIDKSPQMRCAYVVLVVAIYWITEVLNIAVTSLLPIVLFPALRILTPSQVATCYMKDIALLLIGGLIVAKCIERQNLHRRIALGILIIAGPNPILQYFGFMLSSWFLSMWISNTATTAMMITIAIAVLAEMDPIEKSDAVYKENTEVTNVDSSINPEEINKPREIEVTLNPSIVDGEGIAESPEKTTNSYGKGMLIGITYASAAGGIATLTGTAPNLILYTYMKERYNDRLNFNFGTFMGFSIPISIICLFLAWAVLCLRFIGFRNIFCRKKDPTKDKNIRKMLRSQYERLGPIAFGEVAALALFLVLVLLWIIRDPGVPLWASIFMETKNGKVIKYWNDSTSAIMVAFLMFVFPSENPFQKKYLFTKKNMPRLLTWKYIEKELPWMLIFLFGGGFALALGCQVSGLSTMIGNFLTKFRELHPFALVFCITLGISFLTEITSNTATSSILLPIVFNMAECIKMHPLIPGLSATLASSLAFCLPVATPPNAIVFSTGRIKVIDLLSTGLILNCLCVVIVSVFSVYYSNVIFNTDTFPEWITTNCTSS